MNLPSLASVLPDRRVLERTIFPYLLTRDDCHRILFVGCRWYTRRYRGLLAGKEYVTVDRDPKQARHGARRHITDSMENLEAHFGPGTLDAIVCNGVVGWGLDDRAAIERAFAASYRCLRSGGLLIVGWNDTPRRGGRVAGGPDTFVDSCRALERFDRFTFPGIESWRYRTKTWNRHVFDFYVK
jgi:SAM-dependent methyltransferase